jgi:hypothetical protein
VEVRVARELLPLGARKSIGIAAAVWEGGLPIDVLPSEGFLDVKLGAEAFAWPHGEP